MLLFTEITFKSKLNKLTYCGLRLRKDIFKQNFDFVVMRLLQNQYYTFLIISLYGIVHNITYGCTGATVLYLIELNGKLT